MRSLLNLFVSGVVAALAFGVSAAPALAVEADLVVEGFSGSEPWIESISPAVLVAAIPDLGSAGVLSSVTAADCSADGIAGSLVFVGDAGEATIDTTVMRDALGWPSADVLRAGFGDLGLPGCWPDGDPIIETRRLRVAEITVDDSAGGDGDGLAECTESVEVGITISSVTETVEGGHVVIEVLGPESRLVGPGSTTLADLGPGEQALAAHRFTVQIDDVVSGYDWMTLVVTIGSPDAVYQSHRHVPIGCGLTVAADPTQITYPVAGASHYIREWLTTHNPFIHEGVDIFASRMVPVVAMADGIITDVNWEHDPYHDGPAPCCALALRHDSGWESWYLHLNNDTPGTDDGEGWGIMPGITRGTRVSAGQVIGFIGDSTNAEDTAPHTHVELHDPAGNPVDPYDPLTQAAHSDPVCVGAESDCFPFVVMSWNSRDTDVWVLQTRLGQAGFSPGIADGIFGVLTDRAVREFQEAAGLDVDGLVDAETWDELQRVVDEGIDLLPDIIARLGDRGPVVVEIQGLLTSVGFSPGPIDGIFGSLTERAVRSFQSAEGITADGRVDAATFEALGTEPTPETVVRLGDRGPAVIDIQDRLTHSGFSPGVIDGIFGSLTERAVRSFQSAAGIPVDGIVGSATRTALDDGVSRVVIARLGDRGASVVEAQSLLAAAGHSPGPIDGIFGSMTQAAVRSFQSSQGLIVDGVVDRSTLNALA